MHWADIVDDDDVAGETPDSGNDLEAWGRQPDPVEPHFRNKPWPTPRHKALEAQHYCSTLSVLDLVPPAQPRPNQASQQCTTVSALAPSQGFDEMRFDLDGRKYTFAEFLHYHGKYLGAVRWQNAMDRIIIPGGQTRVRRRRRGQTIQWQEEGGGDSALATSQGAEGAAASASTGGPAQLQQDSINSPLPPTASMTAKSRYWRYWTLRPQLPPPPPPPVAQPFAAPGPAAQPRPGQSEIGLRDWKNTPFFLTYLRDQHAAAMMADRDMKRKFWQVFDGREALLLACGELYDYLPLHLTNGHRLKESLGVPDALFVTAEVVPRVTDGNRLYKFRVDLFAYMPSGDVHRYHPSDRPWPCQVMRMDSHLFQIDVATATGVGSALHLVPPGLASAPSRGNMSDVPAFTPAHQSELISHDLQLPQGKPTSGRWRLLRALVDKAATAIPEGSVELDVTDGKVFPWWLAIAGCDKATEIIDNGIFKVWVAVHKQHNPHLIVRNTRGFARVSFNKMGLHIHNSMRRSPRVQQQSMRGRALFLDQ